ncbi:MAG: bifunctional phosphopantothenoylcysteine decarboxylase/phosphopantothenate--cysteine ligase CoaBC [Gemmatimonadota bacterium]|nr:MAG: bifunctional phosphopantothenoylcysteine decarboxylase/phosphopantothenate--cysteine ligase CoaBC [Gemmatimonadota bacterium]
MIVDRPVMLGVSGGIACYKACSIVRQLVEAGATVDVVMTASATEFVRPVTFEALSGRTVLRSLWQPDEALAHIRLGRESDLIILAPATANLLARAACGIADDLLTAILLAAETQVLAAPAMNDAMYAHPTTAANIETLEGRGWHFVGPATGPLAEGPSDKPGRMSEPEEIVAHATRLLRAPASALQGKRVLVTAGPTREHIDPVRTISNPSSGKMGFSVAEAAFTRGADVILVSGPSQLKTPVGVDAVRVESTLEMLEVVRAQLPDVDVLVMAAAPADYLPGSTADHKLPRTDGRITLELEPTPDILESTATRRSSNCVTIGFALESEPGLERARAKLERKQLDLIVLNWATQADAGFESDTNRTTFITRRTVTELPLLPKQEVAERLLDAIEEML